MQHFRGCNEYPLKNQDFQCSPKNFVFFLSIVIRYLIEVDDNCEIVSLVNIGLNKQRKSYGFRDARGINRPSKLTKILKN